MVSACANCGKTQPFIPVYPDLGHCAYCGTDLAVRQGPMVRVLVTEMDTWIAESLADLAARLPELDGVADRERFMAFLRLAIAKRTDGNRAGFCKQMGLPPWTVKNWLLRGERPSLPQILAIACGMALRPASMFLSEPMPSVKVVDSLTTKVRARARPPRPAASGRSRIRRVFVRAIDDPIDTRSMAEHARSLGLSCSCLRYWFPNECAALRSKHAAAKRQAVEERRAAERHIVEKVVWEIVERGVYPGRRKVNEALGPYRISLAQPDMTEAYRKSVRQFWHEP